MIHDVIREQSHMTSDFEVGRSVGQGKSESDFTKCTNVSDRKNKL